MGLVNFVLSDFFFSQFCFCIIKEWYNIICRWFSLKVPTSHKTFSVPIAYKKCNMYNIQCIDANEEWKSCFINLL